LSLFHFCVIFHSCSAFALDYNSDDSYLGLSLFSAVILTEIFITETSVLVSFQKPKEANHYFYSSINISFFLSDSV